MIHVDWDELQLTAAERARIEARVADLPVGPHDVFTMRRVIHGYQAILSRPSRSCGTELRVHGSDLVLMLDCVRELASAAATDDASRRSDRTEAQRGTSTSGASASPAEPAVPAAEGIRHAPTG